MKGNRTGKEQNEDLHFFTYIHYSRNLETDSQEGKKTTADVLSQNFHICQIYDSQNLQNYVTRICSPVIAPALKCRAAVRGKEPVSEKTKKFTYCVLKLKKKNKKKCLFLLKYFHILGTLFTIVVLDSQHFYYKILILDVRKGVGLHLNSGFRILLFNNE